MLERSSISDALPIFLSHFLRKWSKYAHKIKKGQLRNSRPLDFSGADEEIRTPDLLITKEFKGFNRIDHGKALERKIKHLSDFHFPMPYPFLAYFRSNWSKFGH